MRDIVCNVFNIIQSDRYLYIVDVHGSFSSDELAEKVQQIVKKKTLNNDTKNIMVTVETMLDAMLSRAKLHATEIVNKCPQTRPEAMDPVYPYTKVHELDKSAVAKNIVNIVDLYIKKIKQEIKTVTSHAIKDGKHDFYFNRLRNRAGMINQNVIDIFKHHGFDIYGGKDYMKTMCNMKFAVSEEIAIKMAKSNDVDERKTMWKEHVMKCRDSLSSGVKSKSNIVDNNMKSIKNKNVQQSVQRNK